MEAEERPSKMRKLSHDAVELEQSAVEHGLDLFKGDERASSKGDQNENQSDADTADSSDGGAIIEAEKAPRPSGMSKNAWKKLQKKADWEAGREGRKVKRKEKIQAKKAKTRAAKAEARAKDIPQPTANGHFDKSRARKHIKLPVTFLIDCGFDSLMMERERISLGSQLTRSYSDNNRAPFQAHMAVSSWGGLLKERFDTILEKHHENWRGVVFTDKDFVYAAEMAKEAMKSEHGGALAGIFSRFRSAEQPKMNSAKENTPADQSTHGSTDTSPNDLGPQKADDLLPGNINANNIADSHATEFVELTPTRQDVEQEFSPASIAQRASSADIQTALWQDADKSLTTNESVPRYSQAQLLSSDHEPSQSNVPDLEQGEIIYLTSDSPYTLDELKPYSTYIIGGLVDKNRHKGICYKTACERGLKTAKLPIGEFMEMRSRFVLATNHVMEIMVRWLECGDWGKAFLDVIPKRKGGKLKGSDAAEESAGLDNGTNKGKEDAYPEESSDHS